MYFGIFATAGFFFITMMNAARYYGILYFFLITALWFEKDMISDDVVNALTKAKKRNKRTTVYKELFDVTRSNRVVYYYDMTQIIA